MEWRNIKKYKGLYQVSDTGLVRRVGSKVLKKRDTNGYVSACLSKDGKQKYFYVHRLVAECFLKNPIGKPEVNHKNGIKKDNDKHNLEWCTRKENVRHASDTYLYKMKGRFNPNVKLKIKEVLEIKKLIKQGVKDKLLAEKFNVCRSNITSIRLGYNWAWCNSN